MLTHEEATYRTANRHHNPMELGTTIAVWGADGTLDLFDATQYVPAFHATGTRVRDVPIRPELLLG